MNMKKTFEAPAALAFCLCVLCAAFAACGTGTAGGSAAINEDDGYIYTFGFFSPILGNTVLQLDQNGNIVPAARKEMVDILTGEVQCLTEALNTRPPGAGKDVPLEFLYTAIYSTAGEELQPYEQIEYQPAFGNYLLRRNNAFYTHYYENERIPPEEYSCLYNFVTGEVVLKNVCTVYKLANGSALLLDFDGKPVAIAGGSSTEITLLPNDILAQDESVSTVFGPYIVAYTWKMNGGGITTLYDENFEVAGFCGSFSDYSPMPFNGGENVYATLEQEEANTVIAKDGSVVCTLPPEANAIFADDELIIYSIYDKGLYLATTKGEVLIAAEQIYPLKNGELFLIGNGNQISVVNRTGTVLKQRLFEYEVVSFWAETDYYYSVSYTDENDIPRNDILDQNLQTLFQNTEYMYFYPLAAQSYSGLPEGLVCPLFAAECLGQNSRIDILNADGSVVIAGITAYFDTGPNCIAIQKGLDIGLIDWQGNWVFKAPIFNYIYAE